MRIFACPSCRIRRRSSVCGELGLPVVTTLAGGYQQPVERVVELQVRTLRGFAAMHRFG